MTAENVCVFGGENPRLDKTRNTYPANLLRDLQGDDVWKRHSDDFDQIVVGVQIAVLKYREIDALGAYLIKLYYQEGYTMDEICERYNIPIDSPISTEDIRRLLDNALQKLREPKYSKWYLEGIDFVISQERSQAKRCSNKESYNLGWKEGYDACLQDLVGQENAHTELTHTGNSTTNKLVDQMQISPRTRNCMRRAGFVLSSQIVETPYKELAQKKGVGKYVLGELQKALRQQGYDVDSWTKGVTRAPKSNVEAM